MCSFAYFDNDYVTCGKLLMRLNIVTGSGSKLRTRFGIKVEITIKET